MTAAMNKANVLENDCGSCLRFSNASVHWVSSVENVRMDVL